MSEQAETAGETWNERTWGRLGRTTCGATVLAGWLHTFEVGQGRRSRTVKLIWVWCGVCARFHQHGYPYDPDPGGPDWHDLHWRAKHCEGNDERVRLAYPGGSYAIRMVGTMTNAERRAIERRFAAERRCGVCRRPLRTARCSDCGEYRHASCGRYHACHVPF